MCLKTEIDHCILKTQKSGFNMFTFEIKTLSFKINIIISHLIILRINAFKNFYINNSYCKTGWIGTVEWMGKNFPIHTKKFNINISEGIF